MISPDLIKSRVVKLVYEYWAIKAAGGVLPRRSDIRWEELRGLASYVGMVDVLNDPLRFRIRFFGTQLVQWAGRDYTGSVIDEGATGLERLVFDDYSGTYLGALHATATDCTNPADNAAPVDLPFATISVIQSGSSISMTISILGSILTISGTLSQSGQFGTVLGTYTSNVGELGNVAVSAMNVQVNSLAAGFSLDSTNIGSTYPVYCSSTVTAYQ